MKKVFTYLIVVLMTFLLCACSSSGQSANGGIATSEKQDYDPMVETIDFTNEKGSLKYVGFEKANSELTDYDNALLFIFEFTNHQTKPSQCQNVFWIQFFQNGKELTNNASYSGKGGSHYELVSNYFSEALKDGTVRFARIVIPEDDSVITISAEIQGSANQNDYQMMEVDISGSGSSSSSSVSSNDIDDLLYGEWTLDGSDGSFFFDHGDVTLTSGSQILSGTYEISTEESAVKCVFKASDGNVKATIPFTYENGTLKVYNNKNQEMTKR